MKSTPVLHMRYVIVMDIVSIFLAYTASIVIRFERIEGVWPLLVQHQSLLWLSLAVRLPFRARFGLYRRLWRYASTHELVSILKVSACCFAAIWSLNFFLLPVLGIPHCASRSVVVLDSILNAILLAGSRLVLRLSQEWVRARDHKALRMSVPNPRQVLIAGAGDAGARIAREMRDNPEFGLFPMGFVDDQKEKARLRIHNVPVIGTCADILVLAERRAIDEVIVAMPSAPGATIREIKRICRQAQLSCRITPGINELFDGNEQLDGKVIVKQLREVRIEDLLRRDPVVTDQARVRAGIEGACVLVTGAGGSIGSELCRQIARCNPSLLLLLGHGEFSIFNSERELRHNFPWVPIQPVIADIRDSERINRIVDRYRPTSIFHAAAHKHVSLMEANVEEAFTNNVLGTQSLLRAAESFDVQRFVLISTDKAVNPTSVMGATKRIAELLVQDAASRTGRPFVAVRFGNVLGSRGSVVPIFLEQIAAGGPVTITHPEMRRYFMTIPEAVQLVLQAGVLGQGGEVFLLEMGEPVKMVDLARDLIELSGYVPGKDIEIVYTGMRRGEKLYEELLLSSEQYETTPHDKIFVSRNGVPTLDLRQLDARIDTIALLARQMQPDEVVHQMRQLVPEFLTSALPSPADAGAPTPDQQGVACDRVEA